MAGATIVDQQFSVSVILRTTMTHGRIVSTIGSGVIALSFFGPGFPLLGVGAAMLACGGMMDVKS